MAKNITKEELEKLEKEYKKELGLDHICYIYKITNLVNNKKYIGLTTVSIKSRWKKHISESKKEANQSPLYCDMREFGIENFTIECIEECTLEHVQHREQYWIKYYNTFLDKSKGYNLSIGGELGLTTKADEEVIIKTYKKLKTIQKVCEELNIDHNRVSKILTKNGIKIKSPGEHQKEKGNTILQYDLEGKLLNTFQSRTEAGQWLINNKLTTAKSPNDAGCLIRNILARDKNEYKGYYWKYKDEYPQELKDKFLIRKKNSRTFSKCPICQGNKDPKSIFCAKCRIEENMKNKMNKRKNIKTDKKIKIDKTIKNETVANHKRITKKDICPVCGNKKLITSKYCIDCSNTIRAEKAKEILPYKISRIELKNLIRIKSFTEIGQIYNVSDNTIRKWCKKYNLPYRKFDIDKYTDEDWELENWNLDNLEKVQKSHKRNKPTREQLKQDLYTLTKEEIKEKYDYADRKDITKLAKEYGLLADSSLYPKISPEEWEKEKWHDKEFIKYIKKERIRYYFPTRTELKKLVRKFNFVQIGELYKVDSSYVNDWLKYFNLPSHAYEVKQYTDEEWENEIWNNTTPIIEKGGQADE